MKLSEMNTVQLADALVALSEPLSRIGRDPAMNRAFTDLGRFEGATALEKASHLFVPLTTALLKTHRADTLAVLSALTGKGVDALERQRGLDTLREAKACFDQELLDFFR